MPFSVEDKDVDMLDLVQHTFKRIFIVAMTSNSRLISDRGLQELTVLIQSM